MKLSGLISKAVDLGNKAKEHDTAIMTAVNIGGSVAAVVLAFRNAAKAKQILANEELEAREKLKRLVPVLGPVVVAEAVSAGAGIGLFKKSQKLGQLLSAAVSTGSAVSALLKETEEKTKEIVGEEKAEEIQKEVRKSVSEKGTSVGQEVYDTGTGKYIYQEKQSGLTIRASKDYVVSHLKNIQLWVKDQWRNGPEGDEYVAVRDIVEELSSPDNPHCNGNAHKLLGYKVADLRNGELHFNIKETFNYKHENGEEEPGYYIEITDNITFVPDWAVTYR